MKRTLAVVLAGGEGARLSILSEKRAKPAVPFGGKYRIIDFALSNCINSDIDNVVVLTQYNPRSLNDHIGRGRPWDLDRNTGGVRVLQPFIGRNKASDWYRGTADAVLQNLSVVDQSAGDDVVVLAGDHVYKMDYGPFVTFHRRKRADVTIAVRRVALSDASRMGILAMDETGRVTDFAEKPKQPRSDLASMGVYVFAKRALHRWLTDSCPDFGGDVIPAMLAGGARVYGYRFDGYWQDVGTIQSYWEANMALLDDRPDLDLYDREWLIHTRSEERAPARVAATAQVHRSLVSHGCLIDGTVVNSVLSPGVEVGVGAVVRDSIVMFDSVIRPGAVVDRAILDKQVVVGPGAIVGDGVELDRPNRLTPSHLSTGITIVGKQAVIPRGVRIGRNVRIDPNVRAADFTSRVVPTGATISRHEGRTQARAQRPAREAAARGASGGDGGAPASRPRDGTP
ncbi:MAG: glucose-1-phosphate adenylyltransferase subunit GlgD [Chloroflexi bacterium]|nr:glucose-1-phosphate adenylyltransferase subunit GlgD [Chloroflexota bacterium]